MAIPLWVLGKHLTNVAITPLVEDANGNLSAGAGSQTLLDTIDGVRLASNPATENINALTRPKANHVILEDDTSIIVTQILTRRRYGANTKNNVLPYCVASWDLFEMTFTRGGDVWTGRFTRGPYADGVVSKGKNTVELSLLQVDDAANPLSYTGA